MKESTVVIFCLSVCVFAAPGKRHGFYALEENEVRPIAQFAVSKLGAGYSLESIAKKQAQLVQGLLYSLTLKVKKTTGGVDEQQVCFVQVHYIPWQHEKKLLRHNCRSGTALIQRPLGKSYLGNRMFRGMRLRGGRMYRPHF